MDQKPLNLAIVGCGNIARAYGKTLQPYPQLKLLGATDRVLKLAEDYVATFGGKVYPSLEVILADEEVDLVINLTIHHAHAEVITQCLNAGYDARFLHRGYRICQRCSGTPDDQLLCWLS